MLVIGLTGGSGTGKGFVSDILRKAGIVSLDTDTVYHYITDHKGPCVEELTDAFGNGICNADGSLNRKALAAIVFRDDERRASRLALLNGITHKYVKKECDEWLSVQEKSGARVAVLDVPLLFESGFDKMCEKTVAVTAPKEMRLSRITVRDGITKDEALARLESQPSDEFYRQRADFILINDGTAEALEVKVANMMKTLGFVSENK